MFFRLKFSLFAVWLLASSPGNGSPVPQRVVGLSGSPELVCALTFEDPSTWVNSGASFFLENFIRDRGSMNWDNRIDQETTKGATIGSSNLDCADLITGNCRPPGTICTLFTPPSVSFIRNAMFTCNRLLYAYHGELVSATVGAILMNGALVADFGPPSGPDFNIFGILAGVFTVAAGGAAAVPALAGPLTVVAGALSIRASVNDPTVDLRNDIDARLGQAFDALQDSVRDLAQTIFGRKEDTSLLSRISPPATNGETTDIGRFFSGGRFLIPATINLDVEVENYAQRSINLVRQALAIRGLVAQGYFIWQDTEATVFEACGPTASRFIDGKCFKIVRFTPNIAAARIEDIPRDTALKLDNQDYRIVVEDFYRNAEACQNANPDGNGQVQFEGLPFDGSLPQCFFNMRVVTGRRCIVCQISVCSEIILQNCP